MNSLPDSNTLASGQNTNGEGNQLFPVFLKLNELHTVLIGAGHVGLEKLTAIVNNSYQARVTVVAERIIPEVYKLAKEFSGIIINQKSFTADDLDMAQLVIAATDNSELNNAIRQAAHKRNLLVNVADKPPLCDFYLGSIVKKGDLKIGISTNGKSPTVAKRLKEVLNESLPNELGKTLLQMNNLRNSLTGDFTYKVKKLNEITSILVKPKTHFIKKISWLVLAAFVLCLLALIIFRSLHSPKID